MLTTLREIMQAAEEKAIAIGAFNTPNLEGLQAVLGAAEELELPVIIQFAQCHEELTPLAVMGPIMVAMAEKAAVPVCVHLDHGETFAYLRQALDMGFTSIMYDGSTLSYRENVENTRKAVAMAQEFGASVEAELGSMGRRESGSGTVDEGEDDSKIYTDPIQAKNFVRETGIDALACSFGTTHGIYLAEPKLDVGIVAGVRREADGVPIVMHGGSGVSREDFYAAIRAGVRKVNYFTYMDKSGGAVVADHLEDVRLGRPVFFSEVARKAVAAMKEDVKRAMDVFYRR